MINVGIIFGGTGPEHEASLASARAVIDGLPSCYRPRLFGVTKNGDWLVGEDAWHALLARADSALLPSSIRHHRRNVSCAPNTELFRKYPPAQCFDSIDSIFPVMDGIGGEDGTLQGFLSFVRKPIVGAKLLAAAQSYNKWTAKVLASSCGVPIVNAIVVTRDETAASIEKRVTDHFKSKKLVVKPVSSGSSFGVGFVENIEALPAALNESFRYDDTALIEEYLDHKELFVGVIGGSSKPIVARPSTSENPKGRPSSYEDKYIYPAKPALYPARISSEIERNVMDFAERIYLALNRPEYARIDFFLCSNQSPAPIYFNEINTSPAMSPDCAFPTSLRAAGIEYGDLLHRLIQLSLTKRGSLINRPSTAIDEATRVTSLRERHRFRG